MRVVSTLVAILFLAAAGPCIAQNNELGNAATSAVDPSTTEAWRLIDDSAGEADDVARTKLGRAIDLASGLGQKGELTVEIAIYDHLLARVGDSSSRSLRDAALRALLNKGVALEKSQRPDDAIAVYDEMIGRFGGDHDDDIRFLVGKAALYKGITSAKAGKSDALDLLEQGLKRATDANDSRAFHDMDRARDQIIDIWQRQAERAEENNQPRTAIDFYNRILARFGVDAVDMTGETTAIEKRAARMQKIKAARDYLLNCLAIKPEAACHSADVDTKEPSTADMPRETYVTEGGGGVLTLRGDPWRLAEFSISVVGRNFHTCDTGKGHIRQGVGTPDDDEQMRSDDASDGCHIRFTRQDGGISVESDEACRAYCGARAFLEGLYLKVQDMCSPDHVKQARNKFMTLYQQKNYAAAEGLLSPLVQQCDKSIFWPERFGIYNDLSIAQFHLGELAACRETLAPIFDAAQKNAFDPVEEESFARIIKAAHTNARLCRVAQ